MTKLEINADELRVVNDEYIGVVESRTESGGAILTGYVTPVSAYKYCQAVLYETLNPEIEIGVVSKLRKLNPNEISAIAEFVKMYNDCHDPKYQQEVLGDYLWKNNGSFQ